MRWIEMEVFDFYLWFTVYHSVLVITYIYLIYTKNVFFVLCTHFVPHVTNNQPSHPVFRRNPAGNPAWTAAKLMNCLSFQQIYAADAGARWSRNKTAASKKATYLTSKWSAFQESSKLYRKMRADENLLFTWVHSQYTLCCHSTWRGSFWINMLTRLEFTHARHTEVTHIKNNISGMKYKAKHILVNSV